MRMVLLAATVASGCETFFPLVAPDAAGSGGEACDVPQAFDPLRYRSLKIEGDWFRSRDACARFGMQLAVFDTDQELADIRAKAIPPYWIGVTGSVSEDGCPPVLAFEAGQPELPDGCVAVGQNQFQMLGISCVISEFPSGVPINTLCETARPSSECAAKPIGMLASTGSGATKLTYDQAFPLCNGELPELSSGDEIPLLDAAATANGMTDVWLRPRYADPNWMSTSGCPSVFPWEASQPTFTVGADECLVYRVNSGVRVQACISTASVLCESN